MFIKLNNDFSIKIEGEIVINQTITILGACRKSLFQSLIMS